jgi:branched-chain amino acid aminotransferase
VSQADLIWMNGELVAYEDAEGSRAHARAALRDERVRGRTGLRDAGRRHRDLPPRRPHRPALPLGGDVPHEIPFSKDEIRSATFETITRNGLKSCYIRPLVFRGAGPMGLYPLDCPVEVIIAVWEWGAYLGEEGKLNGVARRSRLAADPVDS